MTLVEYLVLLENKRSSTPEDYAGDLTQGEVEELEAMLREEE